jgi:hypothetical protein
MTADPTRSDRSTSADTATPDHSPDTRAATRSQKMYLLNEALSREHQRQLRRSAQEHRLSREASAERRYRRPRRSRSAAA